MITRTHLNPHICLSCRRILAQRHRTLQVQLTSYSTGQSSRFTATSQNHEPHDRITRPRRQPPDFIDRRESPHAKRGGNFGQNGKKKYAGKQDAAKLHGYRGRKLVENVKDLNLNSLGESAKAVVLQDSKYTFYAHMPRMDDLEVEHVDIGKRLEDERGLVSPTQVYKSIDALRPVGENLVQSWEEVNDILKLLSDGFTTAQMQGYLDGFKQKTKDLGSEIHGGIGGQIIQQEDLRISNVSQRDGYISSSADPIRLKFQPWRPGISSDVHELSEDPLQGYAVPSYTSKQMIALKILRECWDVEAMELNEAIGQFEITFMNSDLKLLNSGSKSTLQYLESEYLTDEMEGLKVYSKRKTVRITTWKHKVPILAQLIASEVSSIEREVVDFRKAYSVLGVDGQEYSEQRKLYFSDLALKEVGGITSTDITKLSDDVVLISAFAEEQTSQVSSQIDTAKRLLMTTLFSTQNTSYKLTEGHSSLECNSVVKGKFINYPQVEGLNWWEKLRDWSRWTAPVPRISELPPTVSESTIGISSSDKSTNDLGLRSESETMEEVAISEINNRPESQWYTASIKTSALFGNILRSPLKSGEQMLDPWNNSTFSTFSSTIPNVSRVLQQTVPLTIPDETLPSTAIQKYVKLNFIPDLSQFRVDGRLQCDGSNQMADQNTKSQRAELSASLPSIEMRLRVGKDNTIELKDVIAVIANLKSDVMLPANAIDIRYQHRTLRKLRETANLQPQSDFINNSTLDIRAGKMKTPPSITFPIESDILTTQTQQNLGLHHGIEQVRYMFAGLDVRSTIALDWKGWTLLYTSIEAGRAGGRRSELELQPFFKHKLASQAAFVEAANALAHELGDSPVPAKVAFASALEGNVKDGKLSTKTSVKGQNEKQAVEELGKGSRKRGKSQTGKLGKQRLQWATMPNAFQATNGSTGNTWWNQETSPEKF